MRVRVRVAGLLGGLLLAGVLAACSDDVPGRDAAHDGRGSVDPALAAELAEGCPPWDADVPYPVGDLAEGAVSVRLCPGKPIISHDGRYSLAQVQGPEPLTTGVDDLVALVNGLPEPPPEQVCTADGGPRLTYWFTYPGDRVSAVVLERFGCRSVLTGGATTREEGQRLEAGFADALLAQRAGAEPPSGEPEQPRCRDLQTAPATSLPVDLADLAAATVCFDAGRYQVEEVPLTTPELEQFVAAVEAAPEIVLQESPCDWSLRVATVMVVTRWGDRSAYQVDPCGRVYPPRDPRQPTGAGAETVVRVRTPEVEAVLDALGPGTVVRYDVGEGRTTPPEEPG